MSDRERIEQLEREVDALKQAIRYLVAADRGAVAIVASAFRGAGEGDASQRLAPMVVPHERALDLLGLKDLSAEDDDG